MNDQNPLPDWILNLGTGLVAGLVKTFAPDGQAVTDSRAARSTNGNSEGPSFGQQAGSFLRENGLLILAGFAALIGAILIFRKL